MSPIDIKSSIFEQVKYFEITTSSIAWHWIHFESNFEQLWGRVASQAQGPYDFLSCSFPFTKQIILSNYTNLSIGQHMFVITRLTL